MGRAAIAMAAVRRIAYAEPGKITDHPEVRPPTAVMAITALPRGRLCRDAVPTLPLASHPSSSPVFPIANRYHLLRLAPNLTNLTVHKTDGFIRFNVNIRAYK